MNEEQIEQLNENIDAIKSNTSDIQMVLNELDDIKKLLKLLLEKD